MKKYILLSICFISAIAVFCQKKFEPKDTEIWENEPVMVKPGDNGSPPSDAIVLIGNDLSAWETGKGEKAGWSVSNGVATVMPKTGSILTKKKFGSIQLHVEWRAPKVIEEQTGQGRGNSGIFVQKHYEVQVLDSYGNRTYSNGQAGSIYKQHTPLVNATKPALEWQSYDIIYQAPEFDGDIVSRPAYITVIHNGILIQNHVEVKGKTTFIGPPSYESHGRLPIMLQDHGNLVSYRNMWVRELD